MEEPFLCIDPRRATRPEYGAAPDAREHAGLLTLSGTAAAAEQPLLRAPEAVAVVKPGAWLAHEARRGGDDHRAAASLSAGPQSASLSASSLSTPIYVDPAVPLLPLRQIRQADINAPRITAKARQLGEERRAADGLTVWERATRAGDEARLKLELRRQEQRAHELDGCVFSPTINSPGSGADGRRWTTAPAPTQEPLAGCSGRGPDDGASVAQCDVGARLHAVHAQAITRQEMKRYEKGCAELADLTFAPRITPKARRLAADAATADGERSRVEALAAWELESRLKREAFAQRLEQQAMAECTHRPRIDAVSGAIAALTPAPAAKLALNAAAAMPVHERLRECGRAAEAARLAKQAAAQRRMQQVSARGLRSDARESPGVFARLHQEAQERQYDAMSVSFSGSVGVGGGDADRPFHPEISRGTRALVGDDLPAARQAVHDRLRAEGHARQRRMETRREAAESAAQQQRDVGRYLTPTTLLLSTLRKAAAVNASATSAATTQCDTAATADAPRERKVKAPHSATRATPTISETSRVLDAVRVKEAYGAVVPDRVRMLYDRERQKVVELQQLRDERQRVEQEALATELTAQRTLLRERQEAAARLRRGTTKAKTRSADAACAHEGGEANSTADRAVAGAGIYERQMAWRSAKLQQLERKKEELRRQQQATATAECCFSPRINKQLPKDSTSLREQLRVASPGTHMRAATSSAANATQRGASPAAVVTPPNTCGA